VPHDVRDRVVDFLKHYYRLTGLALVRLTRRRQIESEF
jgi:hypothetical protein